MNINKNFVKAIALVIALALIITSFSFLFFLPSAYAGTKENTKEVLKHRLEIMESYFEFLNTYFKDEIDYVDLTKAAMDGATDSLGDKYTDFYITSDEKEAFENSVSNEYSGIGVTMQEMSGQKTIVEVNSFGPAYGAGVRIGDIIKKIDGKDATNMTLTEVSNSLRGEPGTTVSLTVDRAGQEMTFKITRQKVNAASISYELREDGIGYMKVASFDEDTAKEAKLAKLALINKGAKSLIIDLRDNGGGYIQSAIDMADLFLPTDKYITHFERRDEVLESYKSTNAIKAQVPTVLLVNEYSASATELFAGALQDNDAATLVGTTTFGKGIAQQLLTFASGDSAKVSVFYFLTPDKHDIQGVGITPDYIVKNGSPRNDALVEKYGSFAPMAEQEKPTIGDVGLNVYGAQQRLAMLGYYEGSINGAMDAATGEAVKKFQKAEGLYPYPTLDYTTMSRLETAAYNHAYGVGTGEDLQLAKAIELLNK